MQPRKPIVAVKVQGFSDASASRIAERHATTVRSRLNDRASGRSMSALRAVRVLDNMQGIVFNRTLITKV